VTDTLGDGRRPRQVDSHKGMGMTHLRRLIVSLAAGLVLAAVIGPAMALAAPPSASGIVARFDSIALVSYQDPADGLVALTGPPAEQGCLGLGFEDYFTPVQAAVTPGGAVIVRVHVDAVPIHVYRASSVAELCAAVASGDDLDLLGSGTARFTHVDNDWFVSETRMNAFGDAATGTLTDTAGASWSFAGVWRALVAPSEGEECLCRTVHEDIVLRPRGG
jgi:hypothetical protein